MFEIGCTEAIICRLRLPAVSAGQIGRNMRISLWSGSRQSDDDALSCHDDRRGLDRRWVT
jgi:hypothetical protein